MSELYSLIIFEYFITKDVLEALLFPSKAGNRYNFNWIGPNKQKVITFFQEVNIWKSSLFIIDKQIRDSKNIRSWVYEIDKEMKI